MLHDLRFGLKFKEFIRKINKKSEVLLLKDKNQQQNEKKDWIKTKKIILLPQLFCLYIKKIFLGIFNLEVSNFFLIDFQLWIVRGEF